MYWNKGWKEREFWLHETHEDLGLNAKAPEGHKKIKVYLVFDMKHDGGHKARLVASGHLTDIPFSSI